MTLADFGEMFDPPVGPSTVARWRDGEIFPQAKNVLLIEEVTEGDVTYMDMWRVWIVANGQRSDA